jgi:hypothetical protein
MAERLWPGATPAAVHTAVEHLRIGCDQLASDGIAIRWLGATFVPDDESLSCRFDGTPQAVRAVHELAGQSFDRLVVIVEVRTERS